MFTGTEKLRRAGDRQELELARLRKEFVQTRKELAEYKDVLDVTESHRLNLVQRNMLLTRNADVSNFCMMSCLVLTFIVLGLFVYTI